MAPSEFYTLLVITTILYGIGGFFLRCLVLRWRDEEDIKSLRTRDVFGFGVLFLLLGTIFGIVGILAAIGWIVTHPTDDE